MSASAVDVDLRGHGIAPEVAASVRPAAVNPRGLTPGRG